jgi:hypothetical protein
VSRTIAADAATAVVIVVTTTATAAAANTHATVSGSFSSFRSSSATNDRLSTPARQIHLPFFVQKRVGLALVNEWN